MTRKLHFYGPKWQDHPCWPALIGYNIPMSRIALLFYIPLLCLAAQLAVISARKAVVYSDPTLDTPIGFLRKEKIDSLGLDYQTVNAGVSGETSSGGNDRIDWILQQNT